jgi:hypothetical protein
VSDIGTWWPCGGGKAFLVCDPKRGCLSCPMPILLTRKWQLGRDPWPGRCYRLVKSAVGDRWGAGGCYILSICPLYNTYWNVVTILTVLEGGTFKR